jgi:hypothetical protein
MDIQFHYPTKGENMRLTELIKLDDWQDISTPPSKQWERANNIPSPLPDDGLVYERDYIGIESRLLNDTLILCFDKSKLKLLKKAHPGVPIYFPAEIEELYSLKGNTELIKWVHTCKKKFEGWVVPKDKQTFRFSNQEARNEK